MHLSSRAPSVAAFLLLSAGPLFGQPSPRISSAFEERVATVSREMGEEPQLHKMSADQRSGLVEFVVGNMIFTVAHEFGHAVVTELELPVLGKEEDAADFFAIVSGIDMMTNFSERVLVDAGKGWFFNELRDKKQGAMTAFYDQHAMNLQRAYQIVCFLVGSSPEKYKNLAEMTRLPNDRQQTCKDDYAIAAWSWKMVLKPHVRAPEQPRTKIEVVYGEAKGKLAMHAKTFKELQFLEMFADMAADHLVWRAPLRLEMQTCGDANAKWNGKERKVVVCYDLIEEFVSLYREFAENPKLQKRMQQRMRAMKMPR